MLSQDSNVLDLLMPGNLRIKWYKLVMKKTFSCWNLLTNNPKPVSWQLGASFFHEERGGTQVILIELPINKTFCIMPCVNIYIYLDMDMYKQDVRIAEILSTFYFMVHNGISRSWVCCLSLFIKINNSLLPEFRSHY